jgi:uncharacterized protein (DUF362 family)
MSLVSFVKVTKPDFEELKEAIKTSLNMINFNFERQPKKIVIKPNICYYYHPSTGQVTDPRFVAALIEVFRENFIHTSEIFVVESDASAMKCKYSFKMVEYDKMAKKENVELINLSEQNCRVFKADLGGSEFTFNIPELFYDADLVVNVPKPKYMDMVKITCALKNFYGCNAYPKKHIYHKKLDEAIVFINNQIKTDLGVVDGLMVNGKYAKQLNLVMSSEDPVAVDAAASELMGISPQSLKQVVLASKIGIGNSDFNPIGDYNYFKSAFPKKRLKDKLRATVASAYLHIMK